MPINERRLFDFTSGTKHLDGNQLAAFAILYLCLQIPGSQDESHANDGMANLIVRIFVARQVEALLLVPGKYRP